MTIHLPKVVSDCTFIGTDVGLRFKSTRGRGGIVEGIYISNIDMTNIKTRAISFNLYYGGRSVSEMMSDNKDLDTAAIVPVSEETPQFKDIYIRDVNCVGAQQAIYLQGLPEMSLKNVNLSHMSFQCEAGLLAMDADGITVKDVSMIASKSPAIMLYNAQNVKMSDLSLSGSDGELIEIQGKKSQNIDIEIATKNSLKNRYTLGADVDKRSIKISRN
ncbi:MAG: polygalacturonase [Candidatus Pelagisphaera sp.]|jgi:polygalacturonase